MLIMNILGNILDNILEAIANALEFIVLWFAEKIFSIASGLFDIFFAFTRLNIMDNVENLATIVDRIELLIGLFMLFKVVFSFLTYLVSPDKMLSEGAGASSVVRNIFIAMILLVSVDFGFTQLGNLQNALLEEGTVNNIILGRSDELSGELDDITLGQQMTYTMWVSYFTAINERNNSNTGNPDYSNNESCFSSENEVCDPARNAVAISVLGGNPNASLYQAASEEELKTNSLLSIIGGIVLCIMLISFTIDIGVRALKLAFLQMISPIPIISYIQPSTQKNLSAWLKMVGVTFADLFIRIAIMLLSMVLISNIPNILDNSSAFEDLSGPAWAVAYFLFFLAIYIFAKSIPGLIQDLFGIDMKDASFNPFSKAGFGALTGGIIGSGIGMIGGGIIGAKAGGIGGAISGVLTGGFRGANAGRKSKSIADIVSNAKTGMTNQAAAAKRRYEEGNLRERTIKGLTSLLDTGSIARLQKNHGLTQGIAQRAAAVKDRAEKLAKSTLQGNIGGRRFTGKDGYVNARTENQSEALRIAREKLARYDSGKLAEAREKVSEKDRLQKLYDEKVAALTPEQREAFATGSYKNAHYENAVDANNMYTAPNYNELEDLYGQLQQAKNDDQANGYSSMLADREATIRNVEANEKALADAQKAAEAEYDAEINRVVDDIKSRGAEPGLTADEAFISENLGKINQQASALDKDFQIDTDKDISSIEKDAKRHTETIEQSSLWKGEN